VAKEAEADHTVEPLVNIGSCNNLLHGFSKFPMKNLQAENLAVSQCHMKIVLRIIKLEAKLERKTK